MIFYLFAPERGCVRHPDRGLSQTSEGGARERAAGRSATVPVAFSEKAIMLCKAAVMRDYATFDMIARASTPKQAKEISRQTGQPVVGSDAKYHVFTTPEQDRMRECWHVLRYQLLNDLETPCTPEEAARSVPPYMRSWVSENLATRLQWLHRLEKIWSKQDAA